MKIDKTLNLAYQYYQNGNLQQAELIYRKILKVQPNNIDVLHDLGIICYQLGQYDSAIKYIKKALQFNPSNANGYNNLGLALQGKGQLDEAITYYQKALQLSPNLATTYYNLGNAFKDKGSFDEAITYYQKALKFNPNLTYAYNNIGIVFKEKGQLDEAITYFQKALQLNPNLATTYYNLGHCLQKKGRLDEAITCYQKALQLDPQQLNPEYAESYNKLGITLQLKGQIDEAITYYQKALQLNPKYADAYNNLGIAVQLKGQIDEAITYYQKALQLNPKYADAYNNLGNAFKDQGKLNEAESYYKLAIQIKPNHAISHSNILFAMNYDSRYDAQTIFKEHLQFAKQLADPLCSAISPHANEREPNRKLKIGYVSPDFRKHSVAYFIEPVLPAHNRGHYEIFCYSDVLFPDDVTKRIQEHADQWRSIVGMSDEKAVELIRQDKIDILVDLAGHTANNRMLLFARKPAPVQVSWIGYPATTGLSAIDYKIVDNYTDPPGTTEQFYTEELMRLPESFLCYLPYGESPKVGDLPVLTTGHITFGSFNYFAKVSPDVFTVWANILTEIPDSRLIMKSMSLSDRTTRHYAMDMFTRKGISEERIELLSFESSIKGHLDTYNRIDIGLDTFPYNGTTTTCEALWMGVPVITFAENTHASRVGVSLLSNVGLSDLIAKTHDEYVEIAVNFANAIKRLQMLREKLRNMMAQSPLTDAKRFIINLEKCYRKIWITWCNST